MKRFWQTAKKKGRAKAHKTQAQRVYISAKPLYHKSEVESRDCSRRKAQLVINQLNQELDAMGMLTMRGKVQRTYFWEKVYGKGEGKK